MNKGFEELLMLIRAVITGDVSCCTAHGRFDWDSVMSYACEQAVMGILLQAVEMLPRDMHPDRLTKLQLIGNAEIIRQRNRQVDDVLHHLVDELRIEGIDVIVIKGQVIAMEYHVPELRQSGDIDVFVDSSQWRLVEIWIEKNRIRYKRSAAEKHIEIEYKGIEVELHYHLNVFSSKKAQRYWLSEIECKALCDNRDVYIGDGCYCVKSLDMTATIVYLLVHVHHHLLTEGVGLRQLIDLCLFLKKHIEDIDFSKLRHHLYGIEHYKAFTVYCALMNKFLGLSKKSIPFELELSDYVYADKIMEEVWHGGNFGKKNNLCGVKPGLLHSINTAMLVLKHSWNFYSLAPAESRFYWWNKIFWRMKRESYT